MVLRCGKDELFLGTVGVRCLDQGALTIGKGRWYATLAHRLRWDEVGTVATLKGFKNASEAAAWLRGEARMREETRS